MSENVITRVSFGVPRKTQPNSVDAKFTEQLRQLGECYRWMLGRVSDADREAFEAEFASCVRDTQILARSIEHYRNFPKWPEYHALKSAAATLGQRIDALNRFSDT